MDTINVNVIDLLRNVDQTQQQQPVECFRTSLKRKLFEESSTLEFDLKPDADYRVKRFKNNLVVVDKLSSETVVANTATDSTGRNDQFRKRILKSYYSTRKVLRSLHGKRRRSISKPYLNLNNLSIFDTKSVYKFKFEQIIKRIFEKIQNCSLDDDDTPNDDKDILDLNQLFQFNDSNLDTVLDDNLMHSLKASFLGRGSFGKVFLTR